MFNHFIIAHNYFQCSAVHEREEQVDGGMMDDMLNTKSMIATLRGGVGGACRWGRGPGQAEVLTVRVACQSSHQRCVSEDGLAVCVGHA